MSALEQNTSDSGSPNTEKHFDHGFTASKKNLKRVKKTSNFLFNTGFITALILAVICLISSAIYLYQFSVNTNNGIGELLKNSNEISAVQAGQLEVIINGRLVMARLSLLSCGVLSGIAFGFLGFALFLLGIKDTMNANLKSEAYQARFSRMSPGVCLILGSTILIGVCTTRETPFQYKITEANSTEPATGSPNKSLIIPGDPTIKILPEGNTNSNSLPPKISDRKP